jgi:hypothetical protein
MASAHRRSRCACSLLHILNDKPPEVGGAAAVEVAGPGVEVLNEVDAQLDGDDGFALRGFIRAHVALRGEWVSCRILRGTDAEPKGYDSGATTRAPLRSDAIHYSGHVVGALQIAPCRAMASRCNRTHRGLPLVPPCRGPGRQQARRWWHLFPPHSMAMTQAIPPPPRGHVWSAPLQCWVVPITSRLGRRPSPEHILCTEPRCWVLVPSGGVADAARQAA